VYDTLPSYRQMMDREGAAGPADLAIIGSEEQVAERIHEVVAAGATEFVAALFTGGPDADRTRAVLSRLAD
jgi:5,10-methylenetetrahydromethanopterin reductase